jgi:hypothetical protein
MSALGQKQTYAVQNVMSAIPPIADIGWTRWHACLVPKSARVRYLTFSQTSTFTLTFPSV